MLISIYILGIICFQHEDGTNYAVAESRGMGGGGDSFPHFF